MILQSNKNSILCTKGAKWSFLDRVWSLQYESKASKHESKASAFCEPKTSTATFASRRRVLQPHEIKKPTEPLVHTIFFVTQVLLFAFKKKKKKTKLMGSG